MTIKMAIKTYMGGVTVKLIFAVLVAGIGSGFQHGYSTGVVNAPKTVLTRWFREVYSKRGGKPTPDFIELLFSVTVSIYCLGGIIGGLTTSFFASNCGRRGGLIINNLFAIIGGVFMGISKMVSSPELLIVGRLITGYNNGLNSGLCAMYLVEISAKSMRGAVGSVYQLIVTIAILISQIFGLDSVLGTKDLWPILLALIAPVGLAQAILLFLCPESPKYLYAKKGDEPCKNALEWLRGGDATDEVAEIKAESDAENNLGKTTFKQMISQKVLRAPLVISLVIMLAQQLSGINAVIYYSTSTFTKSGFSVSGAQKATLGMGAMNILMTLVSLILVDLAGRKTLLLIGFGSMFIVTCGLTVTLSFVSKATAFAGISVALVILFVVCFAIGPGSIPWFLVGEFFTQDAKPMAASLAVSVNWLANFIVGLTFLPLEGLLGPRVFVIFAIFQLIFVIYIFFKVPETKNKTYEEISQNFQ